MLYLTSTFLILTTIVLVFTIKHYNKLIKGLLKTNGYYYNCFKEEEEKVKNLNEELEINNSLFLNYSKKNSSYNKVEEFLKIFEEEDDNVFNNLFVKLYITTPGIRVKFLNDTVIIFDFLNSNIYKYTKGKLKKVSIWKEKSGMRFRIKDKQFLLHKIFQNDPITYSIDGNKFDEVFLKFKKE